MARALRIEYEGALYHVMARGNGRQAIFRSYADRLRFMEKLEESLQVFDVMLYAYVLMENHYHILIGTPQANLSKFMQQFQTSYTMYFNYCHNHQGHLFQGRFKAVLVENNAYLLKLSRYIHLNPVRTKSQRNNSIKEKISYLDGYTWSSYRNYINRNSVPEWLNLEIREHFSENKNLAEAYKKYVYNCLEAEDEELMDAISYSSKSIGSAKFRRDIDKRYRSCLEQKGSLVDASMRRESCDFDVDDFLQVSSKYFKTNVEDLLHSRRLSTARNLLIYYLSQESLLSQRKIGELLGHSDGATVSKRLKLFRNSLSSDLQVVDAWNSYKQYAKCKA